MNGSGEKPHQSDAEIDRKHSWRIGTDMWPMLFDVQKLYVGWMQVENMLRYLVDIGDFTFNG